jgi:thiol-disulfide isomerase/thioredoxin
MPVIIMVGLVLFFGNYTARAASLEPLLRAAGLSAASPPVAAPDFQLVDVTGALHRLQDQRGKVVFLNFWATWCSPCREEMPLMEQLSQALRQQPFVIWTVNLQESREQVAGFMTENRLHFPALLDADGTVTTLYNVRGLPTTYLIDCAGNTVGWVMGPREWTNEATRSLLTAMLEEARCR